LENPNLLVVDDDPTICESVRIIGEKSGFIVTTTMTTDDFQAKYPYVNPEVILLDLNLGKTDGIELLRWLANIKSSSRIIIISGSDEKTINSVASLGRSQNLHILAALTKPLDTAYLRSLLQSIIDECTQVTKQTLSDAIDKNKLVLFYQPKINIATGKLLGVEALVHWRVAENTIFSPDSFIQLAEDNNLIGRISTWVNHEAMKQCADFQKKGLNIMVSINLSAKLLSDLMLPDKLFDMTKQYGISSASICIEITETAAMHNPTAIMDVLTRFRIKGFSVSIDDFGTGYSSLVELQRMPCNELKIDKSFIINLKKGTPEFIIVRSIINLGHDFGLKVVAEGIETSSTLDILRDLGCDVAQGYYFGQPMSPEQFYAWLQTNIDESMAYKSPHKIKIK